LVGAVITRPGKEQFLDVDSTVQLLKPTFYRKAVISTIF
jgi:hypothetical protein